MRKTIGTLVMAAALAGCGPKHEPIKDIRVEGIPISVAHSEGHRGHWGSLVGVFEIDGKRVLTGSGDKYCPTKISYMPERIYQDQERLKAYTILQAEVEDGDKEAVGLVGHYHGDEFYLRVVDVGGHTLRVR